MREYDVNLAAAYLLSDRVSHKICDSGEGAIEPMGRTDHCPTKVVYSFRYQP